MTPKTRVRMVTGTATVPSSSPPGSPASTRMSVAVRALRA